MAFVYLISIISINNLTHKIHCEIDIDWNIVIFPRFY